MRTRRDMAGIRGGRPPILRRVALALERAAAICHAGRPAPENCHGPVPSAPVAGLRRPGCAGSACPRRRAHSGKGAAAAGKRRAAHRQHPYRREWRRDRGVPDQRPALHGQGHAAARQAVLPLRHRRQRQAQPRRRRAEGQPRVLDDLRVGLSSDAPLRRAIDAVSGTAGRLAAVMAALLVLLVFGLVLARYGFGLGSVAMQEAVLWLHAGIFLLGLGMAFRHDRHVRVDVFSARWSARTRARVELAGIVLFLLPLCVFAVWISADYVAASWNAREGSRDPGGLPGWYLLKALIPLSAALLALQGIGQALRAARVAFPGEQPGA